MGTRRTDCRNDLPSRPDTELCIADGHGAASCFDPRANPHVYTRLVISGDVLTNIVDQTADDKWLKFVLDTCRK